MFIRRIFVRSRRGSLLNVLLINMGLLDELIAGFVFIGLPLLRGQLGLTYEQIGLIFSVAALSGIVFEPPLYLLSDRGSKRWWILGGLLGLTAAYILAGSANSFVLLMVAFALMYPAVGMAVGLSQAALIDDAPGDGTRLMTRWTMLSSIGDFLSPLAVTAIVAFGLGWAGLCWIAAGCWLTAALVLWFQHFPQRQSSYSHNEDEPSMSIRAGLRLALRDTVLLRWAMLSTLTAMLDEIFLTFMILYLRDVLRASPLISGLTVGVGMFGGFLGLFLLDRLLGRITPQFLLRVASLLALVGILGLLLVHMLWFAPLAFFVVSLGDACLYPIVEARAYARIPGRSGMVRFIIGMGQPFEIVLPVVVSLVAARFGLLASLALLGSAPVFFLLLAPREKRVPMNFDDRMQQ
jgi:predicted MFS family arabinose efflux permease